VGRRNTPGKAEFFAEVRSRFGVLPNFFCTAACAPGLIEQLWGFAKSAYLDNPLPSLFKERLFVHLSRFCEIRYCVVRHVGFLVGEGRPSGDPDQPPQSIDEAIALLSRPVPDAARLARVLAALEGVPSTIPLPESESEMEGMLFDALTILFIDPRAAERARLAVVHAFGEPRFEILTAFLAFVRTAHYWTETHPALAYEDDMVKAMREHPKLAHLMLDTSEAEWAHSRQALGRALDDLRNTSGALRSSEERFRALVTATADMLYRMSPDWGELRALSGREFFDDSNLPESNWVQRYLPEGERARVLVAVERAIASKSMFELEHRVFRKDGSLGWVLSRAVPILDENNGIVEWFGAAIDLTARKNAEDALRTADRHKDEFLATLAHELRNPLAPLRNGLALAKRQGMTPAALAELIAMMDRQVNLLVHLVDDLLDVSRITSGKIQLRRETVSLRDVLSASVDSTRPLVEKRRHRLYVEECPPELAVHGDFDRLTQVFSNLLSNAAKYTEEGGTIELRVRREEMGAVISVVDSGIGIPAEELHNIFEIFTQIPSHLGHAEGGMGIGLSLVRQLVDIHGGDVCAISEGVGRGSTFEVRLPLIQEIDDTPPSPPRQAIPPSIRLA
jgi:signal transduction histidine kinase